jgi:hypothetical protein
MAAWRMAPGRKDAEDYLQTYLENLPRDGLNALYENLLASINPGDRQKAFKMLLLVAEMGWLAAVSLTWIDQLDDPAFPASYEIQPYTDNENKELQATAESEVDDFTKGLLEITNPQYLHPGEDSDPFFGKGVQFFHRTLWDFVKQSKQLRDFSTEFPDCMGFEARARVLLAELWFVKSKYIASIVTLPIRSLLYEYPCGPSRDAQLDSLERVFSHHIQAGCSGIPGTAVLCHSAWGFCLDRGTLSFIHYVTWGLGDVEYIRRRVSKHPDLLQAKDDLSLIVSASLARGDESTMLKMFLDLGASPTEQVKLKSRKYETTASAWMIFCAHFAATMISENVDEYKYRFCGRLEHFLATGVVDSNCMILIAQGRGPNDCERLPTHRISLQQLVQQLEPANGESLLKMMNGPRKGILTIPKDAWRYLFSSKSDGPSPEPTYHLFEVGMQPPLLPQEDGIDDISQTRKPEFFVHSIKWGNTQLMVSLMETRWY